MKTRSRKSPRKPTSGRAAVAAQSAMLIDVADELDLIDGMLRCVPQLHLVLQLVETEDSTDLAHDPVGHWLEALRASRPQGSDEDNEALRDSQITLGETPNALVALARWRLGRVRALLEGVCRLGRHRKGA